ncbi:MAG: hypothetical protein H6839_02380 [Planctomycetes bacterium]|nr:hypothetical protein [Planctomycetota bacterium]
MEATSAESAYLFRHAVVRDAAYGLQPPSERAVLHGLALDILEGVSGLPLPAVGLELARHARMAHEGGYQPERFAAAERRHLKAGGDYARFNYDYRGALEAFERLHGLLVDDPPERAEVADMLADVLQRLGRFNDSLVCFEEVRQHARHPELVGRALVHLAWIGVESGRDVDELVVQGEALAESADSHRLRIAFMMLRAHRKSFAGDHAGAAAEMDAVIDYARRTNDLVQVLVGHGNAARYHTQAGDLAAANAHLDAAEAMCQKPTLRHHLAALVRARAQTAIHAGDYESALRYAREAVAMGVTTGGRGVYADSLCEVAVALTGLGEYPEAFDTLQEVRPIIAETGDVPMATAWLRAYAALMRAWDKPAQAVPVFEEGLAELQGRAPAETLRELQTELDRLRRG